MNNSTRIHLLVAAFNMRIGFTLLLLLLLLCVLHDDAQSPPVSIAGCYSDLHLDVRDGVVTGTGSFRIKHIGGRYQGYFTELIGDGGEYAAAVEVRNFKVDERKRRIRFDIILHDGRDASTLKNVSGQISHAGVKMSWRGRGSAFGKPDPFLRRRRRECS